MAATAGSLLALRAIRERRAHLNSTASDKETRMAIAEVPDEPITARENLKIRVAGVRGFVHQLLSPDDPARAADLLSVAGSLDKEHLRELVRLVLDQPLSQISDLLVNQMLRDQGDLGYIFEQSYREKILRANYRAELMTEKSSKYDWKQIGRIIQDQWRFPVLAGGRHGFDPNEHRFLDQFGPKLLKRDRYGEPEVQFLAIKKGKDLVGYVSFVMTEARVFREKEISQLTLPEIMSQANPKNGDKTMVFLSATPLRGQNLGEVVAAGMFAGSDFAKKVGAAEIYLPGLSAYALLEQKHSGESYEAVVNKRDNTGRLLDRWRERLTLFANPISPIEGQVAVNPEFMTGEIYPLDLVSLMNERERAITEQGTTLDAVLHDGMIYLKNSPHVAFRETPQGLFEFEVPAFWMKMRKHEYNSSLGLIPPILS